MHENIFRLITLLEGLSYILLLFIAVPIKHWGGDESYVKILGMPHGVLFIISIFALLLKDDYQWNRQTSNRLFSFCYWYFLRR